ncbi:ankyrin repeat domain-containing protein 50-like isoform X2 [Haliotis rubra]|uniref:ankyrin repeat domain-containing protein 50-like isoform X2 n=1 Tax=Haliotis rubra TaxID=36100 RepID=UPI001EE5A937|nr:ankyrin repeat domain-containing protein 50-like isoform X2 [Haliotis rubra]
MSQIHVHGYNVSVGGQQVIQQVGDGDSEVKRRSQHKAWTTACTVVKEHVLKHPVTTIIGSPGEGKTTTGYLVMNDFLKRRWCTFAPKTPQEYFSHSMEEHTIVLLNDIFGTFEYDENCWKGWLSVFDDIRSHSLKNSHREEPETSSVKYIIISRDYIWREAEHKLGKFINNIFTKVNILDISTSVEAKLNLDDKLQIIHVMMNEHDRELSKDVIERIIKEPTPHGFPHCAELMFTLQDTREDPVTFFREPLVFLKETIRQLSDDLVKRYVFILLLKHGGEMPLCKTTEQLQDAGKGLIPDHIMDTFDVHTFQKTCYVLQGPYLQIEEDMIKFSHPSVLQSVAVNLGCDFPELLIKHCHMNVLKDILRHGFEPSESYVDVTHNIIPIVVDRFAKELCNGNMIHVLSHVLLQWKEFVVKLLSCSDIPKDLPEHVHEATGESCLYLASSNKKNVILEELLRRFPMTKHNLVNALFGCCEFGNSSGASSILSSNQENLHEVRNKDGETFLLVAARNGHIDVCRAVLPRQNVDLGNKQGDTALHLAAEQGNTDLINLLIDQVNDVDQRNKKMETALHKALLGGHIDASKNLLESGADFTKTESMGLTALHCACYTGLSEIVTILVEKGCDIHALNKRGSHAITKGAESGHTEIVELLHNAGCSVHRSNNEGYTCLHFAGQNGHMDTVNCLLRLGCDINARSHIGRTPLMQTVIGNQLEVLEILVENGADINAVDIVGFNTLMVSIMSFSSDGALFLLERGADIHHHWSVPKFISCRPLQLFWGGLILPLLHMSNMMERFLPQNTLSPLMLCVITGQKDVMVNILEQGEVLGENLLHNCCENADNCVAMVATNLPSFPNALQKSFIARLKHVCTRDVAQELIQRGVDVNAFDSNGFAPLHLAAGNGHTGILKVLLDSNNCLLNPRSRKDKSTPLHAAVGNNHTDSVNLLLAHHCEVNSKDIAGRSPVHLACETGNPIVLQDLLAHGADANIQDQKGNTPLHYAAWEGDLVSVRCLLGTGNILDMQNRYSFRAVDYAYARCKTDTGRVLEQRFPPRSLRRRCKLQLLKKLFAHPNVCFIMDHSVVALCVCVCIWYVFVITCLFHVFQRMFCYQ